jgi:hypothetical protein
MNNLFVWVLLFLISIILGYLTYKEASPKNNNGRIFAFMNIFRHTVGYFIGSIIGYYFVQVRYNGIIKGGNLTIGDLILGLIFIISITGWLPFYVKSTHDKIASLTTKIFN